MHERLIEMENFAYFKRNVDLITNKIKKKNLVEKYVKERLSGGGFPIIEKSGKVIFVYLGDVKGDISLVGDMNDWDPEADHLQNIEGTNFYYKEMRLPLDARVEYAYMVDGKWTADPLNKRQAFEGLGPISELHMPKYKINPEINYNLKISHGKIQAFRFHSKILGNTRIIHVYLPADYNSLEEYPTIYVQDGTDYLRFGFFDNVLDNLLNKKLIDRVVTIFVDPVDRLYEYDLNCRYADFLVKELVPYIDTSYSTIQLPSKRLVMGASFGGLISVYVALNYPETFGCVASQSGYLSRNENWVIRELDRRVKEDIKFYIDCGTFENNVGRAFGNFTKANRKMRAVLKKKGYDFVYREFHEGHNWGNWRSRISYILKTFFGARRRLKQ